VRIVAALSTQDERIADEFRAIQHGRRPTGKVVEIGGDVPVGMHMSLGQFTDAISTRIWERVGRANWRPFEAAREYVRGLGLKSQSQWYQYGRSGRKPADIPVKPAEVYAAKGWTNWGDWLGTGRVYWHNWRPFEEAREYVRGLGLKSGAQWNAYCKSGERPSDIPKKPNQIYAHEGWAGMGDWLGTGTIATHLREYPPFEEARILARSLNLKSQSEWDVLARSGKLPPALPRAPHMVYAADRWVSWGDWLGSGRVATYKLKYRPFHQARAFARTLGLKSREEWLDFARSEKRPSDIPTKPEKAYAKKGWAGMGDWLGTGRIATGLRKFRPFGEARAFVCNLNLNSANEWRSYCKSGRCPSDIPATPNSHYANDGWTSWADWLGTTTIATNQRQYRLFNDARIFVRSLGLKSANEWRGYTKSGKLPADIPAGPNRTYANKGWLNWGDWLGKNDSANPSTP
jgi:hypothetical protein